MLTACLILVLTAAIVSAAVRSRTHRTHRTHRIRHDRQAQRGLMVPIVSTLLARSAVRRVVARRIVRVAVPTWLVVAMFSLAPTTARRAEQALVGRIADFLDSSWVRHVVIGTADRFGTAGRFRT